MAESKRSLAEAATRTDDPSLAPPHDRWVPQDARLELSNEPSAAITPMVAVEAHATPASPDLLRPEVAAQLSAALETALAQDLVALSDASLRGEDALGSALDDQLTRWASVSASASASASALTRSTFERWLRAAESVAGGIDLGRVAGDRAGTVRAALVTTLGHRGDPESQANLRRVFDAGVSHVLQAIEGSTSARDSKISADFLSSLGADDQASALTEILAHRDDQTAVGLARFGEMSPDGMLYHLFEHLAEPDRRRLARSLVEHGTLTGPNADRLCEGRSLAARHLPWTTGHAEIAVEHWAKESDSELTLTQVGRSVLGVAAATLLPETAMGTILTLASGGLATGLVAVAPTPLRALVAGATLGATTYFATGDLAKAIIDKSRRRGAALPAEDRPGTSPEPKGPAR
ncbi:MAG: hypothetical protein IT384_22005 [Deltaproteobacteria bacterium]|nr:hypothetical protein [Deltaproteobacteria bacterium]